MGAKAGDTITVDGTNYVAGQDGQWHPAQAVTPKAMAPAAAPARDVSVVERLKRGAAHGPANLMGLVAQGMNWVDNNETLSGGGHVPPFKTIFGVDTEALANAPWSEAGDEAYRQTFGGAPPPAPEGFGPKVLDAIGGGLATPAGPGGKTVGGLAREAAGLIAGNSAAVGAEEAGLPWWAQLGLGAGGSMSPSVAEHTIAKRGAKALTRESSEAAIAAASARARANPESAINFLPSDVGAGTMQRASSEFKTMIPQGEESRVLSRLDRVIEEFPDQQTRPTTSQAIDELGGATLESTTMSLDRGDRTVSRNLAGQKIRAVRGVDAEYEALRPAGDLPTAQSGYDDVAEAAVERERAAWNAVPLDQMPRVPVKSIKDAEAQIRSSVGKAGASDIPGIFGVVRDYDGTEPFSELQSLRSKLLRIERAGRSPMATEQAMGQGGHASRLRQHVEALIDDVAENSQVTGTPLKPGTAATVQRQEGVSALREAHRITRENRELFDQKSPVVKAFEAPKEAQDIARGLLRGGPPDSRRALSMFRTNEAAQDSVKLLVMNELIGPDILTEGAAKSAMKRLLDHRQTAVALFGADHIQNVERVLRKARTVRSGRAGTRAAALGTGSNTLASDAVTKLESAMESVGQRGAVMSTVAFAKKQTLGRVKDTLDRDFARVIAAATIDPELARDLLRIPGPAAIPKWADRMDGHFTRNGIRIVPQIGQDAPE